VPTLQSLGIKKVISFRAFHADDKIGWRQLSWPVGVNYLGR